MPPPGRRGLLIAGLAASAAPVLAQAPWSVRPVRLIASYAPGGGVDVPTRLVPEPMGVAIGQPIVVENRAGATGSIGAAAVAAAAPDGYTILSDASGQALNPSLLPTLSFDYATAFAPIGRLCILPQVLVVLPGGSRSFPALIEAARKRSGMTYASSGIASGPHLAGAVLSRRAGLGLVHVAYRGSAPAMQDVLAGAVDMAFSTTPHAPRHADGAGGTATRAGRDDRRAPALPARCADRRRAGVRGIRRQRLGRPLGTRRHARSWIG